MAEFFQDQVCWASNAKFFATFLRVPGFSREASSRRFPHQSAMAKALYS